MVQVSGPSWWPRAERASRSLKAISRGASKARHWVYVILLHDARKADPWGVYVGQTSRDPDLRFDQHKNGYKASGAAKRFGVRLVPDLTEHLNSMRQWESLELEPALADAFRAAGAPGVEVVTKPLSGAAKVHLLEPPQRQHLFRFLGRPPGAATGLTPRAGV